MMAGVRSVSRIVVVSKESEALELARKAGWETIVESRQSSESASVDFASRECAAQGIDALLRVPIDLPLAEPVDIEGLFERLDEAPAAVPSAVIVPSGDGTGTNALLRTPPELFPSRFGTEQLRTSSSGGRGPRNSCSRGAQSRGWRKTSMRSKTCSSWRESFGPARRPRVG